MFVPHVADDDGGVVQRQPVIEAGLLPLAASFEQLQPGADRDLGSFLRARQGQHGRKQQHDAKVHDSHANLNLSRFRDAMKE
ncbi:MAG: hypothetical protein SFV51_18815 [Bryobacteraceae bacterium]|nr:hypothetical protein [Bryobacteraceae bacterium]